MQSAAPPCSTLEPAPTQTTTPASGGAIGTSVDAWTLLATLLHGESDGLILASHTLAGRSSARMWVASKQCKPTRPARLSNQRMDRLPCLAETHVAPQCTLECTAHKPPRFFKIRNWRNKNNSASSSSASSYHKEKEQKKGVKSFINPPANIDEFSDRLIVPQLEQLEEKMEEFRDIMAQQYVFLSTQLNVLESSAIQKIG
nr:MADS-box transcription factor 18-like [Ipomoea batatas]